MKMVALDWNTHQPCTSHDNLQARQRNETDIPRPTTARIDTIDTISNEIFGNGQNRENIQDVNMPWQPDMLSRTTNLKARPLNML